MPSLILDAGTGIRRVTKLLEGASFHGTILLGHLHWDHIMGCRSSPRPTARTPRCRCSCRSRASTPRPSWRRRWCRRCSPSRRASCAVRGRSARTTRGRSRSAASPSSPVRSRTRADARWACASATAQRGRVPVGPLAADVGPGDDGLGALHPAAVALAEGVDLLLHDAEYTTDELPGTRRGVTPPRSTA